VNNQPSLVIGASGLVGQSLLELLRKFQQADAVGTYARHPRPGLLLLDIASAVEVRDRLITLRPSTIFLPGALTHVDHCEEHPDEAFRVNAEGVRHVAREASRLGAKLIFYSTDYVFDGKSGPYDEEASVNPINIYGHSKLEGEKVVRDTLDDHLIIRTTGVYDWEPESNNFAMQIYRRVQQASRVTAASDQVSNPTLAEYLAEATMELLRQGARGTVHVAGKDLVPRSEFAETLVRTFGGNPDRVVAVTTPSLKQKAARPLQGGLKTEKVARLLGREAMGLEDGMKRLQHKWRAHIGQDRGSTP
jgi:dTDP-4-dehydrorhamnose reductase